MSKVITRRTNRHSKQLPAASRPTLRVVRGGIAGPALARALGLRRRLDRPRRGLTPATGISVSARARVSQSRLLRLGAIR